MICIKKWLQSVNDLVDPTAKLYEQIKKIEKAQSSGNLSADVAAARISQLKKQIESLVTTQQKADGTFWGDVYGGQDQVSQQALDSYDKLANYYQSINDIATKSKISEEIQLVNDAIAKGIVGAEEGKIKVKELQDQLSSLSSPYDGFINGSSEALAAIQNLTQNGTSAYNDLAVAINAVASVQALLSGNYLGAAAGATSILSELMGGDFEDISVTLQADQSLSEWGDKSTSIANATETTATAAEELVGINTDMLDALTNLTSAISSASGIIAKSSNTASVDISSLGISDSLFDSPILTGILSQALGGGFLGGLAVSFS